MRALFNITFTTVTPESAEQGDYAEAGFRDTGLTLREAWEALRFEGDAIQADCWPVTLSSPPRWLEFSPTEDYQTGEETTLALHIPNSVTAASRMRIARLFGLGKKR